MWGRLYRFFSLPLSVVAGGLFMLAPRGRWRLSERFGYWKAPERVDFWFHGASAGEIGGLLPLLSAMQRAHAESSMLCTATSDSGVRAAECREVPAHLVPFDHPRWLERPFRSSAIGTAIIAETELWPELISLMTRRAERLVAVNARISDYTERRYRCFRKFFGPVLGRFSAICADSDASAARFAALGADRARIHVTGNMKYDRAPSLADDSARNQFREAHIRGTVPIVILGSLRPGEEDVWFGAIAQLLAAGRLNCAVLIAPRHLEKLSYFAGRLKEFGLSYRRYTECVRPVSLEPGNIVVIDTFGLLEPLYSVACMAFIGASLVDIGGHNPLEAAAYGVPLAMGPYRNTVRDVCDDLVRADALTMVSTESDAIALLADAENADFAARGARAQSVWRAHRGATEKVCRVLESLQAGATN